MFIRVASLVAWVLGVAALGGCLSVEKPPAAAGWVDGGFGAICVDRDGDGFGVGCGAGVDCDDGDAASTNECRGCAEDDTGCACDGEVVEEECYLDPVDVGGRPICHEGTRYCRDGAWTACLQLTPFALPGNGSGATTAALVTGPVPCNPCNPSCYSTTDTPGPGDVATSGSGVIYTPTPGGITLPGTVTMAGLVDTDGDGVPDTYDLDPADPVVTGFPDGYFHVLPLGATALDPLRLSVRIRTADVYILMDTTGSMSGEIANLRSSISGTIIPQIRVAIPDAWFGVGDLQEYPVDPYGYSSNFPYRNRQDITDSVLAAQAAVNTLTTNGNITWPESSTQALYSMATGLGLGPYYPARAGCPAGTWGYPCFRDGTVPIVVLLTDAGYMNGPTNRDDYDLLDFGTYPDFPLPTPISAALGTVPAPASVAVTMPDIDTPRPASAAVAVANTNETYATARPIGELSTLASAVTFTGSTAAMVNHYSGTCGAGTRGDAVYSFTLAASARVSIDTIGSAFNTSLDLRGAGPGFASVVCNDDIGGGIVQSRIDRVLAAGTYYIVVDGRGPASGAYTLNVTPFVTTGPTNETFATARTLGELTVLTARASFTGSTCRMASDYVGSCGSGAGGDAVFSFSLAAPTRVVIDTVGSGFDTTLSLRNSAPHAEVACDDDGAGLQSRIDRTLAPGDYFVILDGKGALCGNYALSVTHYVAGVGPETYADTQFLGDVTERSASVVGRSCGMLNNHSGTCSAGAAGDAVFSFTLTAPRRIVIDTEGSSYDTSISLRGDAPYAEVACDNDSGTGNLSRMLRDPLPAGTYFVIVDGRSSACGDYKLNLTVTDDDFVGYSPPTYAQTIAALNARDIRVIVVESSDGYDRARADADLLATATNTVGPTGTPLRYSISGTGAGLGTTVVDAIRELADYNRLDITARANDNAATVGFDERTFVNSIVAVSFPPGRCSGITGGVQFNQCLPGTTVNFQVNFLGVVAATAVAQRFDFTIDVLGSGSGVLSTVPVTIVIPPMAPTYPVSGTYTRDYDATTSCAGTELPRWRNLSWTAAFPTGTGITWSLRSAATVAALATATPVSFTAPASTSPQDVGARLLSGGVPATLPHLRLTATLNANPTRTSAPLLSAFNLLFDCVPGE